MQFELMDFLMNPFVLMFTAVIAGILFGKIRFGRFSFGISGTLFTGLLIGWLVFRLGERILEQGEGVDGFKAADTMMANGIISSDFFNFFLILFVAAVGLLASKDMKAVIKKYGIRFVLLGILITFVGGAMTYGVTLALTSGDSNASAYEISGVYTGALTSSPGLAAALETAGKHSEGIALVYENATLEEKQEILDIVAPGESLNADTYPTLTSEQVERYKAFAEAGVGIGHAVAYPFGVLIIILGVNFFPRIFRMDMEEEWKRYEQEMHIQIIIYLYENILKHCKLIAATIKSKLYITFLTKAPAVLG
jgi:putative transport protein